MKKFKRVIVSILAATITITSVGIITAYASERTYSGITIEYYQTTASVKMEMYGTSSDKHCAITSKAQYNSNCSNWPQKRYYTSSQQGPDPRGPLTLLGSETVLCGGLTKNYNNNFLFKYNY